MDWNQLWEIVSAPDNVPIIALIPLLAFYMYLAWRQAHANDLLIAELETNPAMAKTHHRKAWPFQPGWQKEIHVWPFLLRVEFLAAIIVTIILMIWSITLNAPLEEPANPNLTMNPAKAPWYFLGLQEMLVYFDPWIAGVVMPTLIIVGLMVIPYIDTNPLGRGLLYLEAAQVCDWRFSFRIHRLVGVDDYHRHVHSRAGLAMVLARTDLGPQSFDLRSKPGLAGYFWHYVELGQRHLRGRVGRRILRHRWTSGPRFLQALRSEKLPAKKFAAILADDGLPDHHARTPYQDDVAAAVPY